ncbi:MAG: surface/cell-adhesion protein [Clostridiales bacterium]|jgi:hypothetical protein|nr:surface/cell-adhesion protein [Clostridiales bacterium]
MKKLISIFISIILVLSVFTGCAKDKAVDEQSATNNAENITSSNKTTKEATSENTETSVKEEQSSTDQNTNTQSTTTDTSKTNTSSSSNNSSKPAEKPTNTVKPTPASTNSVNLDDVLNKAVFYLEKNAAAKDYKISDWDAIGLKILGQQLDSKYIMNKGETLGKEIDNYYMTDYARTILGVIVAGYDPRNFQGIDLVSVIKNSVTEDGKFKDTIKGGEDLVNCHVWSMIALEASGTDYDREKALKYLEGKQNKDGGFYIFAPYPDSDADFTAMSVLALTMAGRDSKSPAVSNALNYLKGKLADMEKDPTLQTAETLSVILEAIVAAGDDVKSYKINGKNIADELLTFREADGGFKHLKTGSVNEIASRQVVTALGFYKNNKNMYKELKFEKGNFYAGENKELPAVKIHNAYYDVKSGTAEFKALVENLDEVSIEILSGKDSYRDILKPVNGIAQLSKQLPDSEYDIIIKGTREGNVVYLYSTKLEKVNEKITASVRIESYDKNVLYNKDVTTGNVKVFDYDGASYTQGKVTVYSFVMKALNSMGIKSNVSYSYGAPFIASINDIAGGKFGGWDGWMYFVNGVDPGVGMTDLEVKAGDEILVYYGDWGIKPLEITLPGTASKVQTIEVSVKADGKGVAADVWVNGKKYITDANGILTLTIDEVGSLEVYAEKLDEKGKPMYVRSVKKVIVVK